MIFDRAIQAAFRPEPNWSAGGYFDRLLNFIPEQVGTDSGIEVSPETAFNVSAFFCATTVISNAVKMLPLFTYEDKGKEGRERANEHPVYKLLHRRPNDEMTPSHFKGFMQVSALSWDSAYAAVERNSYGTPTALWPIHPQRVTPVRADGGELQFKVDNYGVEPDAFIANDNILRVFNTSSDGVTGMAIPRIARETLGLSLATEKHGSTFFGNGARPGAIIKHPVKLGDEAQDKLRASLWKTIGGIKRMNRVMVLDEGMDFMQVGLPNEVSQFLETRQFQITEVARWFNIPPHMLKDLLRATFSNIEHQSLEFVTQTMMPWYLAWEEEINRKLFTAAEQDRYYVKFNTNALLRGDANSRARFYGKMFSVGLMNRNEMRQLEDLNPIGPEGDVFLVPANMTTMEKLLADDAGDSQSAPANDRGAEDRMRLEILEHELTDRERRIRELERDGAKVTTERNGYKQETERLADEIDRCTQQIETLKHKVKWLTAEHRQQIELWEHERAEYRRKLEVAQCELVERDEQLETNRRERAAQAKQIEKQKREAAKVATDHKQEIDALANECEKRADELGGIRVDNRSRINAACRIHLRDAFGRIVTREVDRTERGLHRSKTAIDFEGWCRKHAEDSEESIRATLRPVWDVYLSLTETTCDPEAVVERYVGSSRGQLLGIVRDHPDDWQDAVEARLVEWSETRADQATESELNHLFGETENANST